MHHALYMAHCTAQELFPTTHVLSHLPLLYHMPTQTWAHSQAPILTCFTPPYPWGRGRKYKMERDPSSSSYCCIQNNAGEMQLDRSQVLQVNLWHVGCYLDSPGLKYWILMVTLHCQKYSGNIDIPENKPKPKFIRYPKSFLIFLVINFSPNYFHSLHLF